MLRKISTSLFLLLYFGVSSVSFAEEVVLEIITETSSAVIEMVPDPLPESIPEPVSEVVAPIAENIPEAIVSDTPIVEEIVPPVASGDVSEPTAQDSSAPEDSLLPPENVSEINENMPVVDLSLPEGIADSLNAAPEENGADVLVDEIPTTEEPVIVEVEKNSVFTPPGPEPEPWQPAVREDPTTESNTPVGDTETQSDPAFLAENSVFTRRMAEAVVVDRSAKHSCKVDVFRTDVSGTVTSTLSVKFFGTSALAAYDAEIGSLPNGIDVRFEKNNDYLYDFRGKETTLQLVVNNQDGSLTGDFTIPIIYTLKGKKESSVICQLNIVNDEEETVSVPALVPIEAPVEPAQEFVEELLENIVPEPQLEPVIDIQPSVPVQEIQAPEEEVPVPPMLETPEVLPSREEQGPLDVPAEIVPPDPVSDPLVPLIDTPDVSPPVVENVPEPAPVPDPVPEIVTPVIEILPIVESTSLPFSDVSST